MGNIVDEFIVIIILILINGIFAMTELAIVSAKKARLQQKADEGDEGAKVALELASEPNRFLSTVQIGITLIGIMAGAFGGATLSQAIAEKLKAIEIIAPYSGAIAMGSVVILITYLSLVLGELVPKRIALSNPEKIASFMSPSMKAISGIARPFVRMLSFSTEIVLKVFGIKHSSEAPVTEEEIKLLIKQGTQDGVFQQSEQEMIARVFRLDDLLVTGLMTPRPEVTWLDISQPMESIYAILSESRHFCFPVANGNLDNVIGVVYAKDLLGICLKGHKLDIEVVMQPPLFVPESMPSMVVLEKLKEARSHIALVIDEYGGFHGLVTLNDFLEAIVGDIPLLDDEGEADIIVREDGSWLLDGRLLIDDFKELFQLDKLPGEDAGGYQTLGGFVVTYMGCIPTSGDHFIWNGLRLEVVDMDARRVDKVLVSLIPASTADESGIDEKTKNA